MKNFIWDFDGTLFDSYPHITKAMCIVLDDSKQNYKSEQVSKALQISFDYAFRKYSLSDEEITKFRSISKKPDLEPIIKPYPDTKEILEYVIEKGGNNFIYTHRDTSSLVYYLEKYQMLNLFKDLITLDNRFKRKPDPEGIDYLIKKYKLDKNSTIMIGDREIDVLSGKSAGIKSVLFNTEGQFYDTIADYTFSRLSSIKKLSQTIL